MNADRDKSEPPVADGGAPAGNPLHGIAHDRDADRTIPTDDQRHARYADAVYAGAEAVDLDEQAEVVAAVMAAADAEQAELRATIHSLREDVIKQLGAMLTDERAKVARVEALTPEVLTERVSASLQANQDQQVEVVVLDVIRAALAEPEATDAAVYASVPHDREIHTPDALEWPGKEDA